MTRLFLLGLGGWMAARIACAGSAAWERSPVPLLTNFENMYQPCVVEVGGQWPYQMWFFGWAAAPCNAPLPGCDAIFCARSKDLLHWEVYAGGDRWDGTMNPRRWDAVIHASERWYDNWHNGDPSVVRQGRTFYMAYSATSRDFSSVPGYPANMVQCVMGATSEDGVHWRKTEVPLLIRAGDTEQPKSEPGRVGDFHRPCLRREAGTWRLWFDYWHRKHGVCMGYAENKQDFARAGGFQIRHELDQPLLENWPNPEVVKIGKRYHAFGDPGGWPVDPSLPPMARGWRTRQLREAVSDDGIHWTRLDFIPPDTDAEACHVPQTLVTRQGGREWLYLFYSTQVGLHRGDGAYHFEYDRIRAMRRPIE
jgi:hypothetical protein